MNHLKKHLAFYMLIVTSIVWLNLYSLVVKTGKELFKTETKISLIETAEENVQNEPTEMKEWVLWKVKSAGLNVKAIDCLLTHESGYREMAYYINQGGKSLDRGLWMWNDHWNARITNECAFDYKCSTEAAIAKIKRDGNMNAWYGYVNNCR